MSPEHSARDKEERSVDDRTRFWQRIVRETRAVSLWTLMSISLRGILLVLGMLSMLYIEDSSVVRWGPLERWEESWRLWKDRLNTPLNTPWLLLARWILMLLPSKVPSLQAPGFIFANPWLLLWIGDTTGILPNIPLRVCEYAMDRISLFELGALLPIHIVVVVFTSVFLQRVLPDSVAMMVLEPLDYTSAGNPPIVDFCLEVMSSTAFTVGILVLPVLFQLNHLPKWAFGIIMYPIFNFAVDGSGMASSFSPNIVLALNVLRYQSLPLLWRLMASILGGLCGGRIMRNYFPDQEGMRKNSAAAASA